MDATGVKLLNLMFRPNETVCVSHNKFGYHSMSLEDAFKSKVSLLPVDQERPLELVDGERLALVALNPIQGFRTDANCTAYRNFLVEMDTGPLDAQKAYAIQRKLPYSAIVFSGNKSLHFLISLDKDLPNEKVWREFAEWILNIMTMADQATKNPSRSIRIPGAIREPGKIQRLEEFKGSVKFEDLYKWLASHPESRPMPTVKRKIHDGEFDLDLLRPWVGNALKNGLNPRKGRNQQWFAIACEFALAGCSEDDTIDKLSRYFTPDRDFKEKEWMASIRSAFKYIYENRTE